MTELNNPPQPADFDEMLRHFKQANERAQEVHEENDQAAFYQDNIPDAALLELTLKPLAEEQRGTVEEIRAFVRPELYRQLGESHLAVSEKLAHVAIEHSSAQKQLDEEEERVNQATEVLLRKAPVEKFREIMQAANRRKAQIKQQRELLLAETEMDQETLSKFNALFEVASYPWPVPLIEYYSTVNLGELVDAHAAAEEAYYKGEMEEPGTVENWEERFTQTVDQAISDLAAQGILQETDVHRRVISTKSDSDTMGTDTALYRLAKAGVISREKRDRKLMGPFEVVANSIFNASRSTLGKGPRQKRAIEIIREQLETYFAQHRPNQ